MTKILFVSQNHLDALLFYGVSRHLKDAGIDSTVVSYMRYAYKLHPTDVPTLHIEAYDLQDIQRHWGDAEAWLTANYPGVDIDRLIVSDKALSYVFGLPSNRRDRRKAQAVAVAFLKAWEKILDQERPDYIFTLADGCIIFRTLYTVTQKRGIPTLCGLYAPFPGRTFWVDNEFYQLTDFPHHLLDHFTPEQQAEAQAYLQRMRKAEFSLMRKRKSRFISKVRQFGEYAWVKLRYEMGHDHWTPLLWADRYARRLWRTKAEARLYSEIQPGERFIFFPMHDPFDSQLGVRAPEYLDQFEMIEAAVKALPEGYKLYIKPHPLQIGAYPVTDLKRVLASGKVRLMNPRMSALTLIAQSSAVLIINSNAGLEGVMLQKPVVAVGRPYFANSGYVYQVPDLASLKPTLAEAVERGKVAPSDEALTNYLLNLREVTYEGNVLFFLTEENEYMYVSDAARELPGSPHIEEFTRSVQEWLNRAGAAQNHPES